MKYKVIIEQPVYSEINAAVSYYDELEPGLGKKFFNEISGCIEIIRINPFFQVRYKDYRFLPVKTFPFVIVFEVDQTKKVVVIWSLFHTSQNPKKLPK